MNKNTNSRTRSWLQLNERRAARTAMLVLVCLTTASGTAQTYTVIKRFTGSDGFHSYADLVLAGSTLYGTTLNGGSSDYGVVFKVNTDGSGYTVLKNFTGSDGNAPWGGGWFWQAARSMGRHLRAAVRIGE